MPKKKYIQVLLKVAVPLFVVFFLYSKFEKNEQLSTEGIEIVKRFWNYNAILPTVVLLSFVNWGLESLKWKWSVAQVQKISFSNAFAGVLTGLTYSFITPRSVGDYIGRILQIDHQDRLRLVGAVALSRVLQLLNTITFGLLGLYTLYSAEILAILRSQLHQTLIISVLTFVIILVSIFYRKSLLAILKRIPFVHQFFGILKEFSSSLIMKLFTVSMLRYFIFILQFFMLFQFYDVQSPWIIGAGSIAAMLLFKSVLPSVNFISDIGIRTVASVLFFTMVGASDVIAMAISFNIWLINILFPTLIGVLFSTRITIR